MRLVSMFVAVAVLCLPAKAHDHSATPAAVEIGDLSVSNAWARAMLPGQTTASAYFTVSNRGAAPDRLLSASSPVAARVEAHSMTVVDDVMVMRPLPQGLDVPAGGEAVLEPGGLHLMLIDVAQPLAEGADAPLILRFEKAGAVTVPFFATARIEQELAAHREHTQH